MEPFKDWALYLVGLLFGMGAAWGDNVRRSKTLEKKLEDVEHRQKNQEEACARAGFINAADLDRHQTSCQVQWRNEFIHVNSALSEIKQDIKDVRTEQQNVRKDLTKNK